MKPWKKPKLRNLLFKLKVKGQKVKVQVKIKK